ncbi:SDR family NAD(P)-dependent oxidoreductase [Chthonobacter albigriseus]|uniref:SDR family NAD(P)-dependent oxidoreductase n=1 Tax=Chthonobacter albigriseus TaxID=1683161 RepID=UPI0015EFD508|nr:SDR family oxidoreductase [Chthonobacter albigriseus]
MTLPGLKAKRVLVTGASRGIGEAVAAAFVAAGAEVIILAEDPAVEDTARRIGAVGHVADIADEKAVARVAALIPALDVLVNNAGLERMTPIDDAGATMLAVFRRVIEVNVVGTTIVTQAMLPAMGSGGRIINTASIWGRVAEPMFGAYVASKHAVIGLTKTWAKELGPRGIAVNAVAPGWVRTEGSMRSATVIAARTGRSEADVVGQVEAAQALAGGLMEPPDVVGPYLYLASDLARNVTGQTLGIDRGEVPW